METDGGLDPLSPDVIGHYLRILGIPRRDPNLEYLRELVSAHLTRVPFENISKLYYHKRLGLAGVPDITVYLDGIEKYHFGGTCYANNYHLHRLLRSLGYEAKFCAADMSKPAVHAVNMITIDGREYLADVGYGAPFPEPIPRNLDTDYEAALGRDRYVLKPQDANGCSRLEHYRDGALRHGYSANPAPRKIEDFSPVIAGSYSPNSTFMNAILLVRFFPGRSVVIHNLTVIESDKNTSSVRALSSRDELIAAIEKHFGMPREVVSEAISGLGALRDVWS